MYIGTLLSSPAPGSMKYLLRLRESAGEIVSPGCRADGQSGGNKQARSHACISQPTSATDRIEIGKSRKGPTHMVWRPKKRMIWHHFPASGELPSAGRRYLSFRGKGAAVEVVVGGCSTGLRWDGIFTYCMALRSHDAAIISRNTRHRRLPVAAASGGETISVVLRVPQVARPSFRV